MNDELLDLERELAGFTPVAPSRELELRLAEVLSPTPHRPWGPIAMFIAGLTAVSAIIVLVWMTADPRPRSIDSPVVSKSPAPIAPTLAAYREAWDESPEALNRLLDEHSRRHVSEPDSPLMVRSLLDESFVP